MCGKEYSMYTKKQMLEQSIMELLKVKFGANFLKEMKKKQPKRQAKKSIQRNRKSTKQEHDQTNS